MIAVAVVIVPDALKESPVVWAVSSLAVVVLIRAVVYLLEVWPAAAPGIFATILALDLVETAVSRPYPGSVPGALLGVLVVGAVAWAWSSELARPGARDPLGRAHSAGRL